MTGTDLRHAKIFEKYETLLHEKIMTFPNDYQEMSNKKIYEAIADEFGYSVEFICKVIRKKLKEPSCR